jgi:hypothetical protein
MLLEELDKINKAITESLNSKFEDQFFYGSGTIEDMNTSLANQDVYIPLVWWLREDTQTVKTSTYVPFSDVQLNTIDATYVLWLDDDIDPSLKQRNKDAWTLDKIITFFQNTFKDVRPSYGSINVTGLSQSRNLRNTVEGLQGKGFSITFEAPENLDFCVDCE